jgi:hypothetical protein
LCSKRGYAGPRERPAKFLNTASAATNWPVFAGPVSLMNRPGGKTEQGTLKLRLRLVSHPRARFGLSADVTRGFPHARGARFAAEP